jgi:tryptophan synthase alpha chain
VSSTRLSATFAALKAKDQAGLVAYVMANDPDFDTSLAILKALPGAGADVIELGFPFSDPMADGPAIQAAAERALKAGGSLRSALCLAQKFRETDNHTPVILMGYANPIAAIGETAFAESAANAGVDGAIVVDLPPEEDTELRQAFDKNKLSLIRLTTPTTDENRLPTVLAGISGFVYYVSITGVTGAAAPAAEQAKAAVARLKRATDLPIAVGFGVRTEQTAAAIAAVADAVVVGSAFVDEIAAHAGSPSGAVDAVSAKVATLARAIHGARTSGKR